MRGIFQGCASLTKLNISNFNLKNGTKIDGMLSGCSSLNELNLSDSITSNGSAMSSMLSGFSDELKSKIKEQNKIQ